MIEEWKRIENFKGYEVSNWGRIKSFKKSTEGTILRTVVDKYGYEVIRIYRNDNKRVTLKVHRIVAMYFVDNPHCKPEVNHIDGNKQNNHYANLEWCYRNENIQHAYNNRLFETQREKITEYNLKQKSKQVILLNTGEIFLNARIAIESLELECTREAIQNCCKGKSKTSAKINGIPCKWLYVEEFLTRCKYKQI